MGSRRGDSPLLLFQAGLMSTFLDLGFLVIQLSTFPIKLFADSHVKNLVTKSPLLSCCLDSPPAGSEGKLSGCCVDLSIFDVTTCFKLRNNVDHTGTCVNFVNF